MRSDSGNDERRIVRTRMIGEECVPRTVSPERDRTGVPEMLSRRRLLGSGLLRGNGDARESSASKARMVKRNGGN